MDSAGNSGSLQSSSGAEEECDSSRATLHDSSYITTHNYQPHQLPPPSLPAFNNHHIYQQSQINNPNPNPTTTFFTPSPQHQLLNNLDSVIWSKTLPSFSDHQHFSPVTTTQPPITSTNPTPPPPPRNPKKRTRASRRAPTTVLTTDTNNFRAMVQEFTGIPAPPFTSSSLFPPRLTSSFDLFAGRPSSSLSSSAVMMRSNNLDNNHLPQPLLPPPYNTNLLRPFPHMLTSSSLLDSSNLLNNMQQNTPMFSSNNHQSNSLLFMNNPKTTQNVVSSNGFIGNEPTRNGDLSGNWDGDHGNNYSNGKESSSTVKGDQGFVEPWISSSD